MKQTIAKHAVDVVNAELEVGALQAKQVEVLAAARNSLVKLHDQQSAFLPEIIKALPDVDRALVKEQLPVLFSIESGKMMDGEKAENFSDAIPSLKKDGVRPW
ncbi:hypothetical protein [Dyella sp.]|uniref:hypothetical protein n=1 Tax=Dyella sp. TaxID=1869338 RepID=UPI00284FFBB6|nr:hypothetical protein [Dyella sp.]MDR3445441.1 hypothetical protein [Dyella sp.]